MFFWVERKYIKLCYNKSYYVGLMVLDIYATNIQYVNLTKMRMLWSKIKKVILSKQLGVA